MAKICSLEAAEFDPQVCKFMFLLRLHREEVEFEGLQIDWLVISSSLFNKLASILEDDPDFLFKSTAGRRVSKRVKEQERDRFVGLIKRAAENGMIMLSEVCSIPF
jgi:hypothetical protein